MTAIDAARERLPPLNEADMTDAQRVAAADMLSGPRKSLNGPFHAWLRSPEMATRLGRFGEYLRFMSPLPRELRELTILVTARWLDSAYEWRAHCPLALEAGLSAETIDAISRNEFPPGISGPQAIVYKFCTQLLRHHDVDDTTYAAAVSLLGEAGIVELVGLIGLYHIVGMTLSVARVAIPEGGAILPRL